MMRIRHILMVTILACSLIGCVSRQSKKESVKPTLSDRYDGVGSHLNGMTMVEKAGNWGFVDAEEEEVVPCQYTSVKDFMSTGFAVVGVKVGYQIKYGIIDKTGKVVLPLQFSYIDEFKDENEGVTRIAYGGVFVMEATPRNAQWGVINNKGEEILPCTYRLIGTFSEGMATIVLEEWGDIGYINTKGEVVIPCKYDFAYEFKHGLATVATSLHNIGMIDKKGKVIIPLHHQYMDDISEGLIAASSGTFLHPLYGFYDLEGNVAIPFKYISVKKFSDGLAPVCFTKKTGVWEAEVTWGYINRSGKLVIKNVYSNAEPFSDGMGRVYIENKGYGFVDENGVLAIPCIYTEADDFVNGRARVRKYDQRMTIGKDGEEI